MKPIRRRKVLRLSSATLLLLLWQFALPVHAAPGDLDVTFGTGGKVTTPGGLGRSMALQSDGKLVVAGYLEFATNFMITSDFALARFTASGALDASFGTGGKVTTSISDSSDSSDSTDQANGVALQSDGKIVVAGYARMGNSYDFALARYTTDGGLDASFGTGGMVTTPIGDSADQAECVVVQSDGKILVVGGAVVSNVYEVALVRYTATGALDTSFGTEGKVTTPVGASSAHGMSAVIQPDGKIVVAGGSVPRFVLVRYTASGALDTGFGTGGKLMTSAGHEGFGYGLAVQSDGKIVVAGYDSYTTRAGQFFDFALVRFTTLGSLDTSFDTDGSLTTDFGGNFDKGFSVAVQKDGKIIVAGEANGGFALARYTASGALDTSFGAAGKVMTGFGTGNTAYSVAVQSDGKIVAAGGSRNAFALARYLGDPPKLSVVSAGTGQATISWAPNIPGFVLEETLGLSPARPATWTSAPTGETNPITVPVTEATKFYRLHKP